MFVPVFEAVSWYECGELILDAVFGDANIHFVNRNHVLWASGGCKTVDGLIEITVGDASILVGLQVWWFQKELHAYVQLWCSRSVAYYAKCGVLDATYNGRTYLLFSTTDWVLSVWIDTLGRHNDVIIRHDLLTGGDFLESLMVTSPLRRLHLPSCLRVRAIVSRVEVVERMKRDDKDARTALWLYTYASSPLSTPLSSTNHAGGKAGWAWQCKSLLSQSLQLVGGSRGRVAAWSQIAGALSKYDTWSILGMVPGSRDEVDSHTNRWLRLAEDVCKFELTSTLLSGKSWW